MSQQKMKNFNFENGLKKLEEIVIKLESGNLTLDDSLKCFEEGIMLSRLCSKKLNDVERKVEILIKDEKGDLITKEFDEEKIEKEGNSNKENIENKEGENNQETLF